MKLAWILVVAAASSSALAQEKTKDVIYQTAGSVSGVAWGGFDKGSGVQGAPYSATTTNE